MGYFSFAHIPLIFHLGINISLSPITFFMAKRPERKWEPINVKGEYLPLLIPELPTTEKEEKEIALLLGISFPIQIKDVREIIGDMDYFEITHPNPELDNVEFINQLNQYSMDFINFIHELNKVYPNLATIHLFFAGSPNLAMLCAQQISKTTDPQFIVYNYSKADHPNYGWAINLSTDEIIDLRTKKE